LASRQVCGRLWRSHDRPGTIRKRWQAVGAKLDERERRMFAAAEKRAVERGGLAAVFEATGLARSTIGRRVKELPTTPCPNICAA
jgi:hypothetical protein